MKLPQTWDIPDEIKTRFGQTSSGRQRAMAADGHLVLVLHKAPQHGKREREGVFFWRKPDGSWEYSGKGSGLRRLTEHIQVYSLAEERLDQAYDETKDAEDYFQILEKVAPLHHAARNLYAAMQAARKAVPQDRDIIDLRNWTYDLERTLDLLYVDTKNALDFHTARQSEATARLSLQSVKVADRLNMLAAIFFPVTAIASVFGMNLHSGFESSASGVFWLVFLFGMLSGLALGKWAVRGTQS